MVLLELMHRPVRTVGRFTSLEGARILMDMYGVRHLVVVEEDQVVGVVSDRDLGGPRAHPEELQGVVEDRMARRIVTAPPDATVQDAANLLRDHKIGCLPVLADGRLVGIVTETDLLEVLAR